MTHLRRIMLEELERRNYAPGTIRAYNRTVEHFAQHFRCSPDKPGTDHVRQYQAAMFRSWKVAPNTVTQRLAALRFFYIRVLKRAGVQPRHRIRRRSCSFRRFSVSRKSHGGNKWERYYNSRALDAMRATGDLYHAARGYGKVTAEVFWKFELQLHPLQLLPCPGVGVLMAFRSAMKVRLNSVARTPACSACLLGRTSSISGTLRLGKISAVPRSERLGGVILAFAAPIAGRGDIWLDVNRSGQI